MGVFKKDGNWWIDCYLNGRRIRRKVGLDKRTAQLAGKNLKVRAARGEWLGIEQVKRITSEALCREFLSKRAGKAEIPSWRINRRAGSTPTLRSEVWQSYKL